MNAQDEQTKKDPLTELAGIFGKEDAETVLGIVRQVAKAEAKKEISRMQRKGHRAVKNRWKDD